MNPLMLHTGRGQMAQELGKQFDAQRAAATDECRRNEGAIGVLGQALEGMEALRPHYRDAAQQGEITPECGDIAMLVIDEASGCLRNLKMAAEHNMLAQRGKIAQIESVLDSCQAAFESEVSAISDVQKAEEEAANGTVKPVDAKDPKNRAVGEHPGTPIAKRKAEAQS